MKTNKQYEDSARSLTYAFIGIVVMIVIALLTGCKTKTVLVPVKETKIEYQDEIAQLEDALESISVEGEELFN